MAAQEDPALLLARVTAACKAPAPLVVAIAASLAEAPVKPAGARLEAMLRRQLSDFAPLRARLAAPTGEQAVDGLRLEAVEALEAGRLSRADGCLAEAELLLFSGVSELAALPPARRAAAARLRAERGAVAALRLGPVSGRDAARRYAEAAAIAGEVAAMRSFRCRLAEADLLARLGGDFADAAALGEAAERFHAMLRQIDSFADPIQHATVHERLGLALAALQGLDGDGPHLRGAVASYRAALEDLRPQEDPALWRRLQRRLGLAALQLGEESREADLLDEAVQALRHVLTQTPRRLDENSWALAQFELGRALAAHAEVSSGTAGLEEAIAAFRAALAVWTCEGRPQEWSDLQDRIGRALGTMAQRYGEAIIIEEAIAAFDAALQQRPRETQPLLWAASTANRGEAMLQLAARRRDPAMAEKGLVQLVTAIEGLRAAGLAAAARPIEGRLMQAATLIQTLRTGRERS